MKNHYYIILLVLSTLSSYGQGVCTGNLGENIFSIGDFGSGTANIIQMNPGIAPGYSYTTSPPPNDGFYILTNDMTTSAWDGLWASWLKISDNSDDPNGYMMVVNASFEPGIFYEEIVEGLCENTLYEFSADVINLIRNGVTGHHEPNLSFLLDDEVQYSTGIIQQDEEWHKQGFTFLTGNDQTSVKLTLRNNAPGGIGNDLALDNISFRPCGPSAFANAEEEFLLCANDLEPITITADTEEGAAIQWQFFDEVTQMWNDIEGATEIFTEHDLFEPGEYMYRYLTAGNIVNLENDRCRVISDIATVTVLPIEFTVYDTICENVAYEFGSQVITEEGFYEETFLSSSGCDSFVDLFLSQVPDPGIMATVVGTDPLCFGSEDGIIEIQDVSKGAEPYNFVFEQENVNSSIVGLSSGAYTVEIQDRFRCRSIFDLTLVDPELFEISLGSDTSLAFGEIYDFEISSNYDINSGIWSGGSTSCPSCVENSTQPFETASYVLLTENQAGCIATDTIMLRVKELGDLFYKPTIFSPNEDGFNDVFNILTSSQAIQAVKVFSIYDRYGNRVHHAANRDFQSQDFGWDGRVNGTLAAVGVYTYFYVFELINNEEVVVKGDVTLVR